MIELSAVGLIFICLFLLRALLFWLRFSFLVMA
jgi:hypothetical protein